jgi:1-phosphatidylinositol-3-phosphate 5-kinase
MKTWIDRKLNQHIQHMIDQVISDFGIDSSRWRKMIVRSTQNAVQTIRPSSRLLNDSIDFNSFIKIITLQYPNQDKCQYVNGVVFKKDVAHRRMLTEIDNPRVLILGNALGYVQDDDHMIDLSAEINQENYNM